MLLFFWQHVDKSRLALLSWTIASQGISVGSGLMLKKPFRMSEVFWFFWDNEFDWNAWNNYCMIWTYDVLFPLDTIWWLFEWHDEFHLSMGTIRSLMQFKEWPNCDTTGCVERVCPLLQNLWLYPLYTFCKTKIGRIHFRRTWIVRRMIGNLRDETLWYFQEGNKETRFSDVSETMMMVMVMMLEWGARKLFSCHMLQDFRVIQFALDM